MDSRRLALLCRRLADNKKAENVVILDVRELSSVTDYFVIASGTSEPHLRAIVDEITDRLREDAGLRPNAVDGTVHAAWVVLDYFDVIVHVMRHDVRERYNLGNALGRCPPRQARKAGFRPGLTCEYSVGSGERACGLLTAPRRQPAPYLQPYSALGGVSAAVWMISSSTVRNSSSPGAGMMMVSRRPPTSSVIRRNRPRGFSFRARTKVLRSI